MANRKDQHLNLASKAQINGNFDERFNYEPMINNFSDVDLSLKLFNKSIAAPIYLSSITGGGSNTNSINNNLAIAAKTLKLPLALGSMRPLLESDKVIGDYDLRKIVGDDVVLIGNLGIAQIDELINTNSIDKLLKVLNRLNFDGLTIHVNPIQEFLQPEGDRYTHSPIDLIKTIIKEIKLPIIIKEVGSGMGPKSLKALCELDIAGIELAGLGGTNFAKIEAIRSNTSDELSYVGHTSDEMLNNLKEIHGNKIIIASGGIKNYLDGFYYLKKYPFVTCYGMAYQVLNHASSADELIKFLTTQIAGLKFASQFLEVK